MPKVDIACISLDMAIHSLTYDTQALRFRRLVNGITYGDDDEGKAKQGTESALSVIAEASRNGRTIAAQARADIIVNSNPSERILSRNISCKTRHKLFVGCDY